MFRTYRRPSVWREMERFQRDMNRLFNEYELSGRRSMSVYPPINLWIKEDGQMLSAEMPGVRAEDIQLSVEGDTLVISGERKAETVPDDARVYRKERKFGTFSRTLQLPYAVDPDSVDASFKKGILTIDLPRAEEDKPKRITIRS